MSLSKIKCCVILAIVCLSIFTSHSASISIPEFILWPQVLSERRLLQAVKRCTIDFEHQNYTIITSKCKGPHYQVTPCCSSFKEFACPFVDEINDLSNDCVSIMFDYITLIGRYPHALFSSLCREGREGLACHAPPPALSKKDDVENDGRPMTCNRFWMVMMIVAVDLVVSLQFV